MDTSRLVRNADAIKANIVETPDGRLVVKKACNLYTPARYVEKGLAHVGNETYVVGIYGLVIPETGEYATNLTNAMMGIDPSWSNVVTIDGVDYIEFHFEPGATLCTNVQLVKNDILVYTIYNEIIAKGNIPWYMNYLDMGRLFDSALYHGGLNLRASPATLQMIAAVISRDNDDRTKYYRQTVSSLEQAETKRPAFIPFRNIAYGATNTAAKLIGAFFEEGMISAAVNPSNRLEKVEALLRR